MALATSFWFVGSTGLAQVPPLRVLPLGDSITHGVGAAGGYRGPLYTLLTDAGFNVDFVGTQSGNGVAGLPDPDHEGHSGWRIDEIDAIVSGVFAATADPDVILLLIGTNDYGQNFDTVNATNRLEALIARMAVERPFAKIVVANLTQRGEPQNTAIQATFNPFVPSIVEQQRALGREVYFTDLYNAVPLSDMPDNLHPNLTGYTKMATNWFNHITNLFSPFGSTNAPAISRAVVQNDLSNVVVTFSKPVADDATTLTNFALSGGVTVLGASLDLVSLRDVTLTIVPMVAGTSYTLTVNGVRDRTAAQTLIAADSTIEVFAYGSAGRGVFTNVAEAADYALVYSLDIPNNPSYPSVTRYDLDLSPYVPPFSRVAYYLELQPPHSPVDFVWVSMDAFTNDPDALGVPTVSSGAVFQQPVTNMNVLSSVITISPGTNLPGGNMEFWPSNYEQNNAAGVPNASSSTFDFGDNPTPGTYGSMQLHNHDAGQVLFAFNRWGGGFGGPADLGIGNRAGGGDPDWTFAQNASGYVVKQLQVFVLPTASTNPPVLVGADGQADLTRVVLTFSKALDETATNLAYYALDGGLTVQAVALDPLNRLCVTLTTSLQTPGIFYTVTVNGVQDRTPAHLTVAPDSTALFGGAEYAKLSLANFIPGTENVTLVPNGDFEDNSSGNDFLPAGWSRFGNMFYGTVPGSGTNQVARIHIDAGNVGNYNQNVSVTPNTDYVLSAYMWHLGDSTHTGQVELDLNDKPYEPDDGVGSIGITQNDANASSGYFVYGTFNPGSDSVVNVRAFMVFQGNAGWPNQPVGALWDNIAITEAGAFIPPSPVPVAAPPALRLPEISGSDVQLTWTANSNSTYRLEYTPALGPANWNAVPGDVNGLGNTAGKLDALTSSNRFYRVRVLP